MKIPLIRVTAVVAMLAGLLAACGKPAPIESVESLVANPERLKELRTQCRADRAKVGEAQCNAVADATRQRFLRPTPSPYASDPLKPAPPPVGPDTATDAVPSAPQDGPP